MTMEKKKPKILYAASTVSHLNNFHLDYIAALRDMGCDVRLMARGEGVDYDIPFEKQLLSRKNRKARKMIREILDKEQFDVIIVNTSLAAFHIRLAARRGARPRIINFVHGYLFSKKSGFIKRTVLLLCEKLLREKTDAIIVMNSEDLDIAQNNRLTDGEVCFVRGMGIDFKPAPFSRESIRRELQTENSFVLFFAGELSGRKNQACLIRAMKDICESIPEAILLLAGEGGEREALEKLIRELSLENNVKLLGYRKDIPSLLAATDVYVTASKSEGLPFNVVEALGAGKTVVASRVKGHTDVVEDGVSGFLYSSDDEAELASLIKKIYKENIKIKESDIISRYNYYSKSEVFSETLSIIKSCAFVEDVK